MHERMLSSGILGHDTAVRCSVPRLCYPLCHHMLPLPSGVTAILHITRSLLTPLPSNATAALLATGATATPPATRCHCHPTCHQVPLPPHLRPGATVTHLPPGATRPLLGDPAAGKVTAYHYKQCCSDPVTALPTQLVTCES